MPAREREPRSACARSRPTLASHVTIADNCIPFPPGVAALVTRRFPPFLYVWPRETTVIREIFVVKKFSFHPKRRKFLTRILFTNSIIRSEYMAHT